MKRQIISCSPDVMGGAPVFAGTRVPVQTLLDYLEAGESLADFLEGFPTVSREQDRLSRGGEGPAGRQGVVRVLLDETLLPR